MGDEIQVQVPAEVERAVARASAAADIEVTDQKTLDQATAILAHLSQTRAQVEAARVFLVKPLNDHVKAINAAMKPKVDEVDRAIRAIKDRVVAYRRRLQEAEAEAMRQAAELVGQAPTEVEPVRVSSHTLAGSASTSQRWTYEVVDVPALCAFVAETRETQPRMAGLVEPHRGHIRALLNEWLKERKRPPEIPGIRFFQEDDVQVRR